MGGKFTGPRAGAKQNPEMFIPENAV